MANIKFSEFTDVISTYSNIFIVGYDVALNDNIRILSTDVPAIIGAITGSGTPGTLPRFITNTSLGDSLISDDGTEVTIAGDINATAFIKVGGTSSEFLKADGSVDSNAYITLTDLSASAPLSYDNLTGAFSIAQADSTTDGYLSALDWNTFNQKQAALGGTGIVKSTSGTISYITDNSANWNTSYNNMIVSAAVTGTTTKTLTLNQQDGGTITASWTDDNTDAVTSVFGRTGAVVAQSGDYTTTLVTEGTNLYFTNARARAAFSESVIGLDYNSITGILSTTAGYGIPTTASQSNWDTAYTERITSASSPLAIAANVLSISQASASSNGYLSSTDWTTFNSKQAAGNYITALTGEATATGPGSATVTLTNSAVIAKILTGLNITGGSISSSDSILTAFGKVQNQINGLMGGVMYQGTWDAATNTPTLTSSEGTQGYYYIVNVAGSTDLDGITDWNVGDWAIFDGTAWQQVDNTDSVVSVNGFTGIVSLTTTNIPEGTNLYYTNARARAAFSETVTGLSYDSITGVLSTTAGYGIPTTASQSDWDTAYNERISSLTTTGSSGAATLSSNILNIPNYTLAGLGGVPTSRTLTINGVTYDLSANRSWSINSMVYPSAGIAVSTGSSWDSSITDNSSNWNTAYTERISTADFPLSIALNTISIFQSSLISDGYLSATDFGVFSDKQDALGGTGLVKSVSGTISYITDNSTNWNTAYNNMIVSAAVSGTATKTLTLTQQDGGTVTASWSDADTGLTSVGVTMPSAFTVSNSPLTSNGTIAITGAGTTAQYVRGDGSLATFPTIASEAQTLITEVYNETGATLAKGTVVYINGGHGNLPTITKALATGDATSAQTYGVVQEDITNMNNGFVVVSGSLIDLNTNSYAPGTILYLSSTTAGEWTSVKQYAPAHLVYVAIVVRQHPTQGVVEIKIQNGYEMDELHNVAAQSPANGDILQYVSSTSLWTKTAGTTTNIAEGTNLYYTDARSRAAFSETVIGLDYNSTTGVLSIQSGYSIPTNASQTQWDTAYTNRITSATSPLSIASNTISMSAAGISTNGYLTSADWNIFNNKQPAGSYITALTGEATASGPGSAAVTLTNNAVTAKVLTGLNITGGTVSATDSIVTAFGKVQNQINGLVGGTIYKGVWNASTNNPSLSSGVGTQGWYYIVNVAGSTNLDGITDWNIGDWAIFDGTAWQQVDNTDSVTSVNGFTGAVSLTTSNISEGTNLYYTSARFNSAFAAKTTTDLTEGTNLYFTNARAQGAISLTTLGTSGAATYSGGVLNIPQYQAALTDPVTGVGTTNYVAKWTSGSAVGNSSIYDNGTFVGIGSTTALGGKLNITFDSTTADAIILKDTRVTSGSGQWRIGPGSGVVGFGIYSDLLGYSPFAISNSGAATFTGSVTANSFVKSGGTSAQFLLADGSVTTLPTSNWNTAYDNMIVSAAVTGTTTKTLTLTQQDGGTITASWTDINTDAVTSVFGRTGAVVAVSGDYNTSQVTESGNLYFTDARARAAITLTTTGTSGAATYSSLTGILNIPQYTDQYVGTVTSVGLSAPTGFSVSNSPVTTAGTIALGFSAGYSLPTTASQTNWDTAYTNRITSATSPLSISSNVISIAQATTSTSGYLSSTDWNTFNGKQAALSGTGIVKSTSGTISYITDNSTNWNTAYNDSIVSAAVTGTTTKTLTLNQQDGGTITASWTDINTDAVTSVFGRTGAVVAVSGDYNTSQVTESGNLYFTNARAQAAISLTTTGTSGAATYSGGVLNIPNYGSALSGYLPLSGGTLTGNLNATSATFSGVITLPQNPVGTTYGNGVAASPTYMITQAAGNDDAIRFYAESAATNTVSMVFEVNDDIETAGSEWIFRNKKTYGSYDATTPFRISGAGVAYANGYTVLTAENYNSYAPTLTGTGASGTWGISISGNAATASSVAWNDITSKPGILYVYGNNQTLNNITQDGTTYWAAGATNAISTYGSLLTVTGGIGWYNQLAFSTGNVLAFRQSINNTTSWTAWQYIITSDTISSQSVNYATTAGALTSMNISQFTNDSGYITSGSLSGYLPLTGGTLTGNLTTSGWYINSTDGYGIKNSSNGSSFYSNYSAWNLQSSATDNTILVFNTSPSPGATLEQFRIGWSNTIGIYLMNDQGADASIVAYQGSGYGGALTGDWYISNNLSVQNNIGVTGNSIEINNDTIYDDSIITYFSALSAFQWYSGMAVDGISSFYFLRFADFSYAQAQLRVYEDGRTYIYGDVLSTNSFRYYTSSYLRLTGSTSANDWYLKQSDSAGYSLVKNATTLYSVNTSGTHSFYSTTPTLLASITASGTTIGSTAGNYTRAWFHVTAGVGATANTHAMFGATYPLLFGSNYPTVYYNMYYSSGWKIASGTSVYGGATLYDPVNGSFFWYLTDTAASVDGTVTPFIQFRIDRFGRCSIGTTASTSDKFYVSGGTTFLGGNTRVSGTLSASGLLVANGPVYCNTATVSGFGTLTTTNPSDARLKEDITPLQYGLKEVMELKPVTYKWKDGSNGGQRSTGLIAQDVQEIMPDYVKNLSEDNDFLGLDSAAINIVLINAIKELQAKIEILENK